MKLIKNTEFEGERPLFGARATRLENVTIHDGESALKECAGIVAEHCRFEGKYPFWHVDGFIISDCVFTPGTRAALWYSSGMYMCDSVIESPKTIREMNNIRLHNVKITDGPETFWRCRNVELKNVEIQNAEYVFFNSSGIIIDGYKQQGKYSFQYCHDIEIRNAVLDTKDAFWETENVTIYDSEIKGEYLGWHSKNLRLVRCHIKGTQPLCYAENLILEDCTMDADCDLAFEYSTVKATVKGRITSVKNPCSGEIIADEIGEIIIDENVKAPANCLIKTGKQ